MDEDKMINSWQRNAVITSGVVLSFAVQQVNSAQAAIVSYNLAGTIQNGLLTGQTFSGTFSYDNSLLTGLGFEFLDVSQVNLNFFGSTFTAVDADSNPTVEFLDGILLGLNFSTSSFTPEFSLIPASGSTEATFSYIGINDSGSGPVQYVLIPEPSTVLGIIALGIGGFLVGRKR
ncbi:MAG: PEP-CTERM sorting domain-containing protein [Microcystis aeruginosa Ma_MB_S_20031200_S102]|uniref:PEP-CTERM sorting domain-containing protein n=1 Tax=Microcystis aeruginosa Ma_MB_S_20031200_S102 TaxID=2486254 RepID=A0A552EZD7_MICAE|nr:MAG: PEP-CTERM sorting domain-containing protein [Microcystis aeruginosa Ma_MB_S_20031200_S102D]TRU39819.1 MAG: PEP-CTERM sorting domain-containing protein [Microcystis aeruginosa Ma_MB_S_20031200_S102]